MFARHLALGLAAVAAVGIILVGARFLWAPAAGAEGYGAAADSAAYLAAKGVRDIAFGVIGLGLLALRRLREAGWVVLAAALVPIGDTVIVLAHGGSPLLAYGVHGTTAAAMLFAGAVLLQGRGSAPAAEGPFAVRNAETAPRSAEQDRQER